MPSSDLNGRRDGFLRRAGSGAPGEPLALAVVFFLVAAGTRPQDAIVAVTRGALEKLGRDELQRVMAHEFSHILNGDMRLNMRLLGVLAGRLIRAAVSRQREYLADASAVQFTRNPGGIAEALRRIAREGMSIENPQAEEASHMLFDAGQRFAGWLATHPPLAERPPHRR